jgi:hypothetical protein
VHAQNVAHREQLQSLLYTPLDNLDMVPPQAGLADPICGTIADPTKIPRSQRRSQ